MQRKRRVIMGRMGYLYILPWIIGFLAFQIIPMISSLVISFQDNDGISKAVPVGLKNYLNLFTADKLFPLSLLHTFLYILVTITLGIGLAVFIAALLYERIKGRNVFKVIFFLPNLVLPVAFGMMMRPVFDSQSHGLVNLFFGLFGIEPMAWLETPGVANWVLNFTSLWYIGASAMIFLAGISNQERSVYEAAEIDGASWLQKLFHITLPLLAPVIFFQIIMGILSGLQIFDLPVSLANIGGQTSFSMGKQNCLATLVFYLYISLMRNWKFGYAAAIGWFIFVVGLVVTVLIIVFQKKSKSMYAD